MITMSGDEVLLPRMVQDLGTIHLPDGWTLNSAGAKRVRSGQCQCHCVHRRIGKSNTLRRLGWARPKLPAVPGPLGLPTGGNGVGKVLEAILQLGNPFHDFRRGCLGPQLGIKCCLAFDLLDVFRDIGFAIVYWMHYLRNDARQRIRIRHCARTQYDDCPRTSVIFLRSRMMQKQGLS